MAMPGDDHAPFTRLGPAEPATPLVIAVPHAGRVYPPALVAASRLSRAALETIEDRHADLLATDAVAEGAVAVVAQVARAWVDLNRDPREIDPTLVRRAPGDGDDWITTDKVAGGLGVVPSRIAAGGAVWRRPLEPAEVAARIAAVHAPYHAAVAAALDAAHARFGVAMLLDCHSMPSLGARGARVVLGDRYGASAAAHVVAAAADAVRGAALSVARNRPYAGAYTLERHGDPQAGRHALQVEVDRSLYLDASLRTPGPGLAAGRRMIAAISRAVATALLDLPLAAE